MSRPKSADGPSRGAFLTQISQKGEKIGEVKKEIAELEQLLAGTNQASQSTLLLKKRKEMRVVDEALELMKQEYKRRMDACEERRLQFESKQVKLREQVLKFEKFIQENDAKRIRAEGKAKHERKQYDLLSQEMNKLLLQIKELEDNQSESQIELQRKSRYADYLTSFVEFESSQGFEEISDVLNRYKTLKGSNEDLMIQVQLQEDEVDRLRFQLQTLKTENENRILVSNSLFQAHQKDLDKMRVQAKVAEEEKDGDINRKMASVRMLGQVIQSIKNLYSRCEATMRNKPTVFSGKETDLSETLGNYLEVLSSRMVDLGEITAEFTLSGNSNISTDLHEASGVTQWTAQSSGVLATKPSASIVNKAPRK